MTLINRTLLTIMLVLTLAGNAFAGDSKINLSLEKDEFFPVDLDQVLVKTKPKSSNDGRRFIFKQSIPVSLRVKLMRLPEKRKIEYLYTAMSVAGIDPLPEVSHRMFVSSAGGTVIPVYVEAEAAKLISQALKVNQDVNLYAYHIYNYAKGPAYLVVGYKKETEQ